MSNKVDAVAPIAAIKPYVHDIHGHQREDNYFWLRDDNRESPEVLAYLEEENRYTEQVMAPLADLQQELYDEMVARQEPEIESVPYFRKGFWYISRYNEGQNYRVYSRRKGTMESEEEIYLDCNERAEGFAYYQLGSLSLSPNGMLLAFAEDTVSRRQYTLYFKDLLTGQLYPDSITDVSDVVWANDNKTLFYVKQHTQTLLSYQVYRHTLGDSPENDVLIYEEQDATFSVSLYKTRSDDYLVIASDSTSTSECLLLNANKPQQKFNCFLPRELDHEYSVDHFQGKFFIRSNYTGKNFALHTIDESTYHDNEVQPREWDTLVAVRESVLLEDYELMQDWLIVEERELGLPMLRQINFNSGESKTLTFHDPVYTVFGHYNPQPNSSKYRYQYTSFTMPATIYELDLDTGETTLLKQSQVMGGFDSEAYQSERVWVTARDGVDVPVSLVYKRSLFNHKNPLLIYAYGSYGNSTDIGFSSSTLSLLDRGFVYAIAHLRGGEELGREWYEQGKLFNKKNTFNDFVDVTKALIEKNYGAKNNVFAMGGSAGGLLMGAVINQAAELYRGVIAAVPFVDVVSTMLDESIPLTTGEYDEWGNPNDPDYYEYMLSYSPYDQVTAKAYPNMLVTTGLHDSQVQYWEPAKWVAKLRALKTDHNQLLLYTDMDAGHGGKSGRFQFFEDVAREFAFFINLANVE
jgi:oligopeptidase B